MMITSSRPSNRRRNILLFILGLVILTGLGKWLNQGLSGLGVAASQPFWQARNGVAGVWSVLGTGFTSKQELASDNANLRQQLVLAQAGLAERDRLRTELETLRAQLGQKPDKDERELARVLIGWQQGPFDILLIDLGSENSLKPLKVGDAVLGPGNVWLGTISEIQPRVSKVKLLTLAGEQTSVVIGPERLETTLEGRGGGNFIATIPRGVSIPADAEAVSSRLTGDVLVATVGAVEMAETGDQRVYLRSPLRASSLPYVEIEH